jgi:tRNA (cmo5U34)-methyltransferase
MPESSANINLWTSTEHALDYLRRADSIPHRVEGESALLECVPATVARVLDLGSGDGRLLRLLKADRPALTAVALDFSSAMLEALRARFAPDPSVAIVDHDLNSPLPEFGPFDAVISSFAIHHLPHARKRSLCAEVQAMLMPEGVFCNLDHVSSPTERLHRTFLQKLGIEAADEDPSNQLLDVETQLRWLRELGFEDVDCSWKWLELALLVGRKPGVKKVPS